LLNQIIVDPWATAKEVRPLLHSLKIDLSNNPRLQLRYQVHLGILTLELILLAHYLANFRTMIICVFRFKVEDGKIAANCQ